MTTSKALRAAEDHVRSSAADLQLDPHVQQLLGGAYSVHGQQQYRGLSIYPHSVVIEVGADGTVTSSGDPLIEVGELDVLPDVAVEAAVRAAFRHLQKPSGNVCHTPHEPLFARMRYRPRVVSSFPMSNRPTVLTAGPLDELTRANLVVFRDHENTPRLGWLISLVVRQVADYTLVVSAKGRPRVLDCVAGGADRSSGS